VTKFIFFLKSTIYIISCVWFDSTIQSKIIRRANEILACVGFILIRHSLNIDARRIVTFKWPVIAVMTCISDLPNKLYFQICEMWICEHYEDFRYFITMCNSLDPVKFNQDVFRRALTTVLAESPNETSCKVFNIWNRNNKLNTGIDVLNLKSSFLLQSLFSLLSEIKMMSISMRGRDEDEMCVDGQEEYLTRKLRNLTNMFQIVDSQFNETDAESDFKFPFDLGANILRVVKKYFSFENIGRFGLEFILSMLKCEQPNCDIGMAIMNDRSFLKFLEGLLNFTKTLPEYCYVAYDIMTCLQEGHNKKKYSYTRSFKVEWSMSRIIPFMKYAVTDVDYLKFFVSLLQCNFNSDLVMIPETENGCSSPKFGPCIQNMMFNTHNLIFQIADETNAVQVWITLTEILKFFDRRIGCSQNPQLNSIIKNLVFSASLSTAIEMYLFLRKDIGTVHTSIIEFIGAWVNLILIMARSSEDIFGDLGEERPPLLFNLFVWIKEWLNLCIQAWSPTGPNPDAQKYSLVVYVYWQAEDVFKIMKRDEEENTEEIDWDMMGNVTF